MRQDLRFAARSLTGAPGFTVVALLTLALGIGANSGIFSVVNAALLQPLPYPHPDQLMLLFERDVLVEGAGPNVVSLANFLDWQAQSRSFAAMAATRQESFNLGAAENFHPERIDGALGSWSLFATLGARPLLGRTFTAEEDKPDAQRVAIISYLLWQRRYGGSRDVLRQRIRLDGESYAIIGVMPQGFAYPTRAAQVWLPVQRRVTAETLRNRTNHEFYVAGRLQTGFSREQAWAELDGIARRIRADNPNMLIGRGASVIPMAEAGARRSRTSLLVLFGAVGCLLLIACVNVANLLLARGSQRRREMAVRAALGAGRGRLLRQLLTESTLLSLLGAAAGIALAYGLTAILAARAPALLNTRDIGVSAEIRVDGWVLLFTAALALLAGLGTGAVPAWQAGRSSLTDDLKEGGRVATASRSQHRFRSALVAAEVALSVTLVVAAGLLVRSFTELRRVRPGVRADHVLTVGLSLADARYAKRQQIAAFSHELLNRLKALPGVRSAGLVSCLPVAGYCGDNAFWIEGRPLPPGQFMLALNRSASPGYFETVGIPVRRGRTFTAQDHRGFDDQNPRPSAAVISESMANKFWPGADALGQRIFFGDDLHSPRYQIIGIVGDVLIGLDDKPRPTMYLPFLEGGRTSFYAVIHTAGEPALMAPAVRDAIGALDPDIPAFRTRTMADILEQSSAQRQFTMLLLALFAALALSLAAVGLYGVLSYTVAQRMPEIGIRIALGATQSQVRSLVLVEGMKPALAGLLLGVVGAVGLTRFLETLLFGIGRNDVVSFAAAPAALLVVALVACSLPAWRATRVDPVIALRSE